jgi:hypothetical protein
VRALIRPLVSASSVAGKRVTSVEASSIRDWIVRSDCRVAAPISAAIDRIVMSSEHRDRRRRRCAA